jgi:hypothetical protein
MKHRAVITVTIEAEEDYFEPGDAGYIKERIEELLARSILFLPEEFSVNVEEAS